MQDIEPFILYKEDLVLCNVIKNHLVFIAFTRDTQPLLPFTLLKRMIEVFEGYFGVLNEYTIRDNFSVIYLLLEEMMVNGYPVITELNSLTALIFPPNLKNKLNHWITNKSMVSKYLPKSVISKVNWRTRGIEYKYTQKEVFIDMVEELDCLYNSRGKLISSAIKGKVNVSSSLSGMPELALSLSGVDVSGRGLICILVSTLCREWTSIVSPSIVASA